MKKRKNLKVWNGAVVKIASAASVQSSVQIDAEKKFCFDFAFWSAEKQKLMLPWSL